MEKSGIQSSSDKAKSKSNESAITLGKRPRPHSACQQCRGRKIKCDGQTPTCGNCSSNGTQCEYAKPKKRGFPPGYIQKLETYIVELEKLVGLYMIQYGETQFKTGSTSSEDPVSVWKNSSEYASLSINDQTAAVVPKDESETESQQSRRITNNNTSLGRVGQIVRSNQRYQHQHQQHCQHLKHGKQQSTISQSSGLGLSFVEKSLLLERYFCYIHSWLPMLNKNELTRSLHCGNDGSRTNTEGDILLFCVLRLASQTNYGHYQEAFDTFEQQLTDYIGTQILSCDCSIVQIHILLLSSLIYFNDNNWNTSWRLVGVAVRSGLQNELQCNSDATARRTWYACCIIDTLISAFISKVPHVTCENFDIEQLSNDGFEEWDLWKPVDHLENWAPEPSRAISVYNALFQLVAILNKLVCQMNQPSFHTRASVEKVMIYTGLGSRLQMWSRKLPEHCNLMDLLLQSDNPISPHKTHLYATFLTLNSLMYLSDDSKVVSHCGDFHFLFTTEQLPKLTAKVLMNYNAIKYSTTSAPFFKYHSSTALALAKKVKALDMVISGTKTVSQLFLENNWATADTVYDQAVATKNLEPPLQLPSTHQQHRTQPQQQQLAQPSEETSPPAGLPDLYWENMVDLFESNPDSANEDQNVPEFLHNLGLY